MANMASSAMTSRGLWMASGGDDGTLTSFIDRLSAAPPPSRRLQQAKSSLEAEYAVLSEASAKNAELQAMLRNSQPLLWLDNALVMQRKRSEHDSRKQGQRDGAKLRVRFADEQPLEVESDLRHRRRVQWEIAKRIARVDREISKQPPSQRSWHVKDNQRIMEENKKRQEEEMRREKQRREAEREAVKAQHEVDKMRKTKETQARRAAKAQPSTTATIEDKAQKAAPKIDVDLDFEWPATTKEKPTKAPTPANIEVQVDDKTGYSDDEKENVDLALALQSQYSPDLRQQMTTDREPEQVLLRIARESFENEAESNDLTQDNPRSDSESDGRLAPALDSQKSKPPDSSLGRQVLSEYRTMPTPVSFGAPPIISGDQQPKRLNNDVLRRLFSDLDADRDGHLNRIETCMALHRLQINVPAPRIVSFFRRIHEAETVKPPSGQRGKWNGSDRAHEPLKQVISYKQFVAFVTAAFDQQQQLVHRTQRPGRQYPPTHQLRDGRRQINLPPLQISRDIASSINSPTPTASSGVPRPLHQSGRAAKPLQEGTEVRLVEQNEEPLADRVLRELPDYLVAQALAASDVSAVPQERTTMEQVVRRSLEKIVGSEALADDVVEDVAQDLIRTFVEKVSSGKNHGEADDIDDTSGLGRAAAFFETLSRLEGADGLTTEGDESEESSTDWWSRLTEEQVGALVQEVWRSRQNAQAVEPLVESSPEAHDQPTEELPPATVAEPHVVIAPQEIEPREEVVEATETPSLRVQRVAEKAIQTDMDESPVPPPPPPLETPLPLSNDQVDLSPPPPPPPSPPPPQRMRTALARAVVQSGQRKLRSQPQRDPRAIALADLRRQRRERQQAAQLVESVDTTSSQEAPLPSTESVPVATFNMPQVVAPAQEKEPAVVEAFAEADAGDSDPHDESTSLPAQEAPSPLPIKAHRLHFVKSPNRTNTSVARSSASSSGIFSSESSSALSSVGSFSFFRRLDTQSAWRETFPRRHYSSRVNSRSRPNQLSGSEDSGVGPRSAGSDDEGDLSEGEIAPADLGDLSDGEIFGATRRKVVRGKNRRLTQEDMIAESLTSPPKDVVDSMESGEMLPSMIHIQRAFHQKLIASSVSSLESGEAEDGMASSL